jgi:hypothetical protein
VAPQQVPESEKIFSSSASVPIADAGLQLEVLALVEPMDPYAVFVGFGFPYPYYPYPYYPYYPYHYYPY